MAKIFDSEQLNDTIFKLSEREKELKCLYKVQGIIDDKLPFHKFLMEIVKHIWGGWQYPMITRVKITFEGEIFKEPGWKETAWVQHADIIIDDMVLGKIEVFYTKFVALITDSQFLPEEQKLLDTIAVKISAYIFKVRLKKTIETIDSEKGKVEPPLDNGVPLLSVQSDVHWIWRNEIAQRIADKFDLARFGAKALYLIGSTKNATSGPASDIDFMVHFVGDVHQEREMRCWFDGWSLCLAEENFHRTGYKTDGLIDLHIITDKDIENKNSFAVMINRVTDRAKLLKNNKE